MKITVLMENTADRPELYARHGLSLFIETKKHKLLMDTGASDLTWENAKMLGVDLAEADIAVLSHGHYDHSGGLYTLALNNPSMKVYMQKGAGGLFYHDHRYIGIDRRILKLPNVELLEGNLNLDEELSIFSNISGRKLWPEGNLLLTELVNNLAEGTSNRIGDTFAHEQCLAVCQDHEYTLVSGCAHNGILNIMEKFEELYHCQPKRVISGFHMMKKEDYSEAEIENIKATGKELLNFDTTFYTGHCTGQKAVDILKEIMGERLVQIHTGDCFEF